MARKKTCKNCKNKYQPAEGARPFENWCSVEARGRKKAKEAKTEREKKKQTAAARIQLKREDLDWQKERTQQSFNKMRVIEEKLWYYERGLEPVCISCGKPNMDWCCGHLKTRGGFPELRFDRKNTFLQCNFHCNRNLSANLNGNKYSHGYLKGLKLRFGEEEGQSIIEYVESPHELIKWTWQELEAFRREINARIRELEKQLAGYV